MWTIERVKAEMPEVKALYNGEIFLARIAGRQLDFPSLVIWKDGSAMSAEFAWETIVHCLNTDSAAVF